MAEMHGVAAVKKRDTVEKISDALLDLLNDKPFDAVSVTEICKKAEVARKTFYRNFDSKSDVVEKYMDMMFDALTKTHDLVISDARSIYAFCYDWFDVRPKAAVLFCDSAVFDIITAKTVRLVELVLNDSSHNSVTFEPVMREYCLGFVAVGICSLIRTWIIGGRIQSAKSMAALTERLLSGVVS